jgi:hypothetical protein
MDNDYNKYIKYKNKYLKLKKQVGGAPPKFLPLTFDIPSHLSFDNPSYKSDEILLKPEESNWKEIDFKSHQENCLPYTYVGVVHKQPERIIAIGDLHGDFDMMIKLLQLGGVINEENNWIGQNTYVIQVGDQIDSKERNNPFMTIEQDTKSSNDIKVLRFLTQLHNQALLKGGAVISLLGNHEIMNINKDFRFVSPKNILSFYSYTELSNDQLASKLYNDDDIETIPTFDQNDPEYISKINDAMEQGTARKAEAFSEGKSYGKYLGCNRIPIVKIGDFIFVHAGLSNNFIEQFNLKGDEDLYRIRFIIRNWLAGISEYSGSGKQLVGLNIDEEHGLDYIDDNMLWFFKNPINSNFVDISKTFEVFNVNNIVVGHMIGENIIHLKNENKNLFKIDIGIGKSKKVIPQILMISYDKTNNNISILIREMLNDNPKTFNDNLIESYEKIF